MKALYKQLDFSVLTWDGVAAWTLGTQNSAPAFESLTANIPYLVYQGGYFDLAGLTKQEKTLFIQGLEVQLATPPSMLNAITGDSLTISLVIADTPLSPSFTSYGTAGWTFGDLDAQNVILGQTQTWAVTQDSNAYSKFMVLQNEVRNGVCTSTASDRIYWGVQLIANVVKVGATTSTVTEVAFPAMRIRLFANATEEQEYQYLMRLKRSYDLQQSNDVDGRRPH